MNRFWRGLGPATLILVTLAPPASAQARSGAWTSWLRAYRYTEMIADTTEVWCSTLQAGLLRFDRVSHTFEQFVREPSGVASNALTALARDRTGRLWVGTDGAGISHRDPDGRWGLVSEFDGLRSQVITCLHTVGDTVLAGTPAGLAFWNGRTVTSLPDGVNPSPFGSDTVTAIVVDDDSVWISTLDGVYLARLSDQLQTWQRFVTGLPTVRVEMLAFDGTDLFAFSTDGAWVTPFRWNGVQWVRQGGLGGFRAIHDDRGTVIAATAGGLFRWSGTGWIAYPGAPISRQPRDLWFVPAIAPDGTVYAANRDGVVEQAPAAPWPNYPAPSPPGNNVTNIAIDGPRVYVNTAEEGIGRFDGTKWKIWPSGPCRLPGCNPDTAFQNAAFAFALLIQPGGPKWFGTWGVPDLAANTPGAIEFLDDSVDPPSFTRLSSWPGDLVSVRHTFAVGSTVDSAGGIWLGMDSPQRETPAFLPIGIDEYDSTGAYVATWGTAEGLLTGRILSLITDRNGRVWFGTTGSGVQYFDPPAVAQGFFRTTDQPTLDVRGLALSGDTLWVQSSNDVRWYNTLNAQFRALYPVLAAPPDVAGHPLEVGADGSVWAGTVNGVRVYERNGAVRVDYTSDNSPLGSEVVRAIRLDPASGKMWMGSSAGLHVFDPGYAPPAPPAVDRLSARVYPNPSRVTLIGTGLRVVGNGSAYDGAVYDLTGRKLREFSGVGNGAIVWDGLDRNGHVVRPGIYLVQLRAGGRSTTVRAVFLR
jgi:ligand-binding sensor domain-containing protein